ncbi:hypothetical protein HMPREF9993_06793, partial [Staphylococcus epidermidis NIHLM087]
KCPGNTWKHFPKIGKKIVQKMETFCLTPKPVLMCLVGVGKCMGAVFSKIGSARRVLGPSGVPKKARFSSSSKGKNYRPIVARPMGWSPFWGVGKLVSTS